MNWRIIVAILIVVVLAAIAVFVYYAPPEIELDVKKMRTHLQNDTLYMNIELENDLLTIFTDLTDYIHITSYIDTLKMADMRIEREKRDETEHNIEIPGAVPVENILELFENEGDSVWLRIYMDVGEDIPIIGHRNFSVTQEMQMVKPRPPKYRFERIADFSLKKDSVHFIPEGYLVNPNPVTLTVIETDLVANIDDRFSATVFIDPLVNIPPHDSVLVTTVIGIQDFQLIKDGVAVVFGTSPLPYTVTGNMTIQLDSVEVLAPIDMEIIHTGEIALSPFANSQ